MPLKKGEVFAGFVIERFVGAGAMGEVYLAQHPRLPRLDALKVLPTALTANDEYRYRFNREADLASTLWHPHIVGIHDRGEFDGQLWISMDFVDGTDADHLIDDSYPKGLPTRDALEIVTAVADALDVAHQRGLLHRDVKPANILLTKDQGARRRILLADFGIARQADEVSGVTGTNMTVGSVGYAAPEQLMGERIDGRADQYGLAVTAFHLLTGTMPFRDSNPTVVISKQLTKPAPVLSERRPELANLDHALSVALSKDPNQRYAQCLDFAEALTQASKQPAAPPEDKPHATREMRLPSARAPSAERPTPTRATSPPAKSGPFKAPLNPTRHMGPPPPTTAPPTPPRKPTRPMIFRPPATAVPEASATPDTTAAPDATELFTPPEKTELFSPPEKTELFTPPEKTELFTPPEKTELFTPPVRPEPRKPIKRFPPPVPAPETAKAPAVKPEPLKRLPPPASVAPGPGMDPTDFFGPPTSARETAKAPFEDARPSGDTGQIEDRITDRPADPTPAEPEADSHYRKAMWVMTATVVLIAAVIGTAAAYWIFGVLGNRSTENQPVAIKTKSGKTTCLIHTDTVTCEAKFTHSPIKQNGLSDVTYTNGSGELHWGPAEIGTPSGINQLDYKTYHWLGWTINATIDGTRFTDDKTGHGMFVSVDRVETFEPSGA